MICLVSVVHPPVSLAKVKEIDLADRCVNIREILANLGVSFGSVQGVMHNVLGMRRVEIRLVLILLNLLQKQHIIDVANKMIS